ncbi:hypothetical protein AAFF_G00219630 [Aldrovandia affinis]|uniref:Uncharacterized protein n=1 Tax=Aldrovandia affinis TaxID=143900 RepID=A0AAD7R0R1_9TELE|nr:hypothetical protein AAFF_G00219630 [Aldrovandia affinis]
MAVDDRILRALDNLSANDLDKFKYQLSTLHNIGFGLIEKESNIAMTQRIINKFGSENAIAPTAKVFRAIGVEVGATYLEGGYAGQGGVIAAGTGGGASAAGTGDTGGSASGSGSTQTEAGQRFVEKHQLDLIRRVTMVEPILDQLRCENLINGDKCHFVMAKPTPRGQMSRLLQDVIYPGGRDLMDALYRSLEENEPAIMRDLKGK